MMFVTLDRGDYWQCAYVIPKGGFDRLRAKGLEAFRAAIVEPQPGFCRPRPGDRLLGRREAADGDASTG